MTPASASGRTQEGPKGTSQLDDLRLQANAFNKTVSDFTARQASGYGLSLSEFAIIRLLLDNSEWAVSDVAETLHTSASTTSRTVSGLADRGLIHKRRPLKDRRTVLLSLTEEGVSVATGLLGEIHSSERATIQGIDSQDIEISLATFRKLVENCAAWEKKRR